MEQHFPDSIFILACGPSLAECNVSKLKNCNTMAIKRAYIAFDDWGFEPTYYANLDMLSQKEKKEEIIAMIRKYQNIKQFFFPYHETVEEFKFDPRVTIVGNVESNPVRVNLDLQRLYTANSGLFGVQASVAILGFRKVFLLGCDARYSDSIKENHFRSDYWDERKHNPPGEYHLPAWKLFFRKYVKGKSLKVFNCARNGALQFYEYCDFNKLVERLP